MYYGMILMNKKSGKLYVVTGCIFYPYLFYPYLMVATKTNEFATVITFGDDNYEHIGDL